MKPLAGNGSLIGAGLKYDFSIAHDATTTASKERVSAVKKNKQIACSEFASVWQPKQVLLLTMVDVKPTFFLA